MADRYFLAAASQESRAILTGPEAQHLAGVMRARPGTEVELFDGGGRAFRARVERVGRHEVELSLLETVAVDRELPIRLTLGVALPRGDRQRNVIERAVELGVARLVPLVTARGVAKPAETTPERLRRAVIEASKQCGRNRLAEIDAAARAEDFFAGAPSSASRWLATPRGQAKPDELWRTSRQPECREIWLAVGPEGGFADEEIAVAQREGWQTLDLGPRILRVETAVAMLAVLAGAGLLVGVARETADH